MYQLSTVITCTRKHTAAYVEIPTNKYTQMQMPTYSHTYTRYNHFNDNFPFYDLLVVSN